MGNAQCFFCWKASLVASAGINDTTDYFNFPVRGVVGCCAAGCAVVDAISDALAAVLFALWRGLYIGSVHQTCRWALALDRTGHYIWWCIALTRYVVAVSAQFVARLVAIPVGCTG